jgi:hypothetical protein
LGLFASSLLLLLTFRNASYIHDHYKSFFVPVIAILGAVSIVYIRPQLAKNRLRKPLFDSLIILVFVSFGLILRNLYATGNQPTITTIIQHIKEIPAQEAVYVYLGHSNSLRDYQKTVEYYTFRKIDWDYQPNEVLDIQQETDQIIHYIYCNKDVLQNLPHSLRLYEYEIIYPNTCLSIQFSQQSLDSDI